MTARGPYCQSGKIRYATLDDAIAALGKLREMPGRRERAAYECPYCDGAHLTSKPPRHPVRPLDAIVAEVEPRGAAGIGGISPHALDEL